MIKKDNEIDLAQNINLRSCDFFINTGNRLTLLDLFYNILRLSYIGDPRGWAESPNKIWSIILQSKSQYHDRIQEIIIKMS